MWELVAFCLRSWTHLDKVFVLEESIWAGASWVQQITWWGGKLGAETKGGMGERMGVELNTCHSIDRGVYVSCVLFVCVQPCWMRMRRTGWTRSRCASSPRWASPRAELSKPSAWTSECSSPCLPLIAPALTHIHSFFVSFYGSPQSRLEKELQEVLPQAQCRWLREGGSGLDVFCKVCGSQDCHCFQV